MLITLANPLKKNILLGRNQLRKSGYELIVNARVLVCDRPWTPLLVLRLIGNHVCHDRLAWFKILQFFFLALRTAASTLCDVLMIGSDAKVILIVYPIQSVFYLLAILALYL